jgi:hypothetical protein
MAAPNKRRQLQGGKGVAESVDRVIEALEAKGVVIESDGVRLRKPRR